jgi:hypothetical protein
VKSSRTTPLTATALVWLALGCGGGGTTEPDPEDSLFTATVDGVAWSADPALVALGVPQVLPGLYTITGIRSSGANPYTIVINLANIRGPGTYPLGVTPQVPGGSAQISNLTGGWTTQLSGAAGTINITTLTATRIVATFSFNATALTGTASGTKVVTGGSFDLKINPTGTIGPVPDNAGSTVKATLGGVAWNAAAVSGNITVAFTPILVVAANNTERALSITLTDVPAPGTYALSSTSPVRQIGVTGVTASTSTMWSSLGPGSSGSVTITSITATRIQGTFSATLGPAPGSTTTGTLTVTGGTFDIGRL